MGLGFHGWVNGVMPSGVALNWMYIIQPAMVR